jgi:hypothetical protein
MQTAKKIRQKDPADFEDRALRIIITRKSTSVDAKSERMRNSLADFREWPLMVKMMKIIKEVSVISMASETVRNIS